MQRCSEVACHRAYSITTPLPQPSPPDPWSRSPHATVTRCQDTSDTALQVLDRHQEVRTCRASCRCCCVLNRTLPPVGRTRRRGTRALAVSVSRHLRRRTTSWGLRIFVSWLPDCCLVPSSGRETYRSFPTCRQAHPTHLNLTVIAYILLSY